MKFTPPLLCVLLLWITGCATRPVSPKAQAPSPRPGTHMQVRTTAYTHSEPGGHKNGIGGTLHFGGKVYSAASDWSWLPLGTQFRMASTGRAYVIEDYGSALVGRQTIDLYLPTRKAVRAWGVRTQDIEILQWGSRVMSLKLLEGRLKSSHVRRMVVALRGQKK